MGFGIFIVFCFFILILTIGENRAFIAFFALCIIGCQYSMSGPVTIEDVLLVLFLMTAIKGGIVNRLKGYPFWWCTGLFTFSILVSSFFTTVTPHRGLAFMESLRMMVLPLLFFNYVKDRRDIRNLVRLLVFVSAFGFLLAILEEVFQEKLYLNFIRSYVGKDVGWEMSQVRFGFTRVQAFCMQSVSYGYICVTLLSVFLLFLYKYNKQLRLSTGENVLVVIPCVLGCLLCGSRSGILPMGLLLLYFYGRKATSLRNLFVLSLAIVVVIIVYGNNVSNMWEATFQSDKVQMGSSSEMRMNQLEISLFYFNHSPFIGMGTYAIHDFVKETMGEAILGGESVWFSLLINQGLLGCVAYIFIYISSFLYIKNQKFDALMFLCLQLFMHTLTSTPGYDTSLILCLVLLAKRVELCYEKNNGQQLRLKKKIKNGSNVQLFVFR